VALMGSSGNPIVDQLEEKVRGLDSTSIFYDVNRAHIEREINELVFGPDRVRLLGLLYSVSYDQGLA
jgi:hypothetical protein